MREIFDLVSKYPSPPVGVYKITVERYGFQRHIVQEVQTTLDSTQSVKVDMQAGYLTYAPF